MDAKEKFLKEVSPQLQRAGFTVWPEHDGLLPVEWKAELLCRVRADGSLLCKEEILSDAQMSEALDRVTAITRTVRDYMRLMEQAPPLVADGLSGDYRLLAEFNGIVLAGHERDWRYGTEFITWERVRDGTDLWQGHYMENDYAAARQDFAVRSGLVEENRLLSDEQAVAVYHCVRDALERDCSLTAEQENLLEDICNKMRQWVPDIDDLTDQMTVRKPEQGMEQSF